MGKNLDHRTKNTIELQNSHGIDKAVWDAVDDLFSKQNMSQFLRTTQDKWKEDSARAQNMGSELQHLAVQIDQIMNAYESL